MKIRLQSFTGGITLIDLAIIFAVLSAAFAPLNARELLFAALFVVYMSVVLALVFVLWSLVQFLVVFGLSLMHEPEPREA